MSKYALAAALAIIIIAAIAISTTGGSQSASHEGATALAADATDQERTVLVSAGREPAPSPPGRVLYALRIAGDVPGSTVQATVISDENCAPDARGISRCTNALRLRSGRILTVRHPHRMMEVPCLEPGEQVRVRRA